MNIKKGEWALIVFNVAYLLFFLILFLARKDYEFLWYLFWTMVAITFFIFLYEKLKLSYATLWAISFLQLMHLISGGIFIAPGQKVYAWKIVELIDRGGGFYILKWDQVSHFLGVFLWAIVIFQISKTLLKPKDSTTGKIFFIFVNIMVALGVGAYIEINEFMTVVFFPESINGVGDYYNNALDLVFDAIGAIAGTLTIFFLQRKKLFKTNL